MGSFNLDANGADAVTWSGLPDPPKDMSPERGLALALLPLATSNFGATLFADEMFLPALNDGDGSTRLYRDSPRVTLVSSSVVQNDGRAAVYTTLDWRRDELRGVSREPAGARVVAERKLWYGLLEGALEHEWVAQQLVGQVTKLESTTAANDDPSQAPSVLSTPLKKPDVIGLKPDPAAEAATAIAAGEVLVVPAGAVGAESRGWWAIAPSGDTRAVWSVGHVINGGHLPPNIPKNNGGPSINYVDPKTGRSLSRRGEVACWRIREYDRDHPAVQLRVGRDRQATGYDHYRQRHDPGRDRRRCLRGVAVRCERPGAKFWYSKACREKTSFGVPQLGTQKILLHRDVHCSTEV